MLKQPNRIENVDSHITISSSTSFLGLLLVVHVFVRCDVADCFRNLLHLVTVHIC